MPAPDVVRTYLEMRTPEALRPAWLSDPACEIGRAEPCSVERYRALYAAVGHAYQWRDRTAWGDQRLAAYLADPAVRVWVLRYRGADAGYFELRRHDDGSVEIVYFGLAGPVIGRGLGKHLLTRAVEEAWALGATRVWLHTCTLDHPAALPNYRARGFVPFAFESIPAPP